MTGIYPISISHIAKPIELTDTKKVRLHAHELPFDSRQSTFRGCDADEVTASFFRSDASTSAPTSKPVGSSCKRWSILPNHYPSALMSTAQRPVSTCSPGLRGTGPSSSAMPAKPSIPTTPLINI